jgi:hypothetical protein
MKLRLNNFGRYLLVFRSVFTGISADISRKPDFPLPAGIFSKREKKSLV